MLLKEKIKTKSSIISKQKKEFEMLGIVLKSLYNCLILHICLFWFLVGNDSKLVKIEQDHCKKLPALK